LFAGGPKITTALPFPGVADTEVGASGGPVGVTAEVWIKSLVQTSFAAAMLNT